MDTKKICICALIALAFTGLLISVASAAEITTEGQEVHIKPSAARGQELVSGFKGANLLNDALDALTYLIYAAAIIDVLICTLVVLVGVYGGKKVNSLKSIRDEIEARDGVWRVSKAIFWMFVGINVIDFLYYYT